MEPKGYELLKIETEINRLEKELSTHFEGLKKYEIDDDTVSENAVYKKLHKMNVCCLKLLETYREYTNRLKNNR